MSIDFQYFSDVLHTELIDYENPLFSSYLLKTNAKAPYLILAGDIGQPYSPKYHDFLSTLSWCFKRIFIIAGNHEYYKTKEAEEAIGGCVKGVDWLNAIDTKIKEVTSVFPNVTFLQNSSFDIPETDITVHGGTFWTHILPIEEVTISTFVKDYKESIPGLTIDLGRSLHQVAVNSLDETIKKARAANRRLVVISHHLPLYDLIDQKYKSLPAHVSMNSAYVTNILSALDPVIVAWVSGNTFHEPIEKDHFYVNPIGYPGKTFTITSKNLYDKTIKFEQTLQMVADAWQTRDPETAHMMLDDLMTNLLEWLGTDETISMPEHVRTVCKSVVQLAQIVEDQKWYA